MAPYLTQGNSYAGTRDGTAAQVRRPWLCALVDGDRHCKALAVEKSTPAPRRGRANFVAGMGLGED